MTSAALSPIDTTVGNEAPNEVREQSSDWVHGIKVPYSVFSYQKVSSESTKSRLNKNNELAIVMATLVIDEAKSSKLSHSDSSHKPLPKEDSTIDNDPALVRREVTDSAYAGYFSVPRLTFNIPAKERRFKEARADQGGVPKLCFQNHYDEDDSTYTFGGLMIAPNFDWSQHGIPNDVDPARVSVHFACTPPPFVSKEILSNPLVVTNRNLFVFNPLRGSLTYLDTLYLEDDPTDINSFICCRVSKKHVFFYGGFKIVTDAVRYDPAIDHWTIEKHIEMNTNGYLLNKLTLKFRKIKLNQQGNSINLARLGATITSSVFEQTEKSSESIPTRVPLPPAFPDSVRQGTFPNEHTAPNSPQVLTDSIEAKSRIATMMKEAHPKVGGVSKTSSKSSSMSSGPTKLSAKPSSLDSSGSSTPTNTYYGAPISRSANTTPISRQVTANSSLSSKKSHMDKGSGTRPPLHAPSSSSSTATVSKPSKMSTMLSKSSKIFHRNHSKETSKPSLLLLSSLSTPQSPQAMKNTYSKHVNLNRHVAEPQTTKVSEQQLRQPSPIKPKASINKTNSFAGLSPRYPQSPLSLENQSTSTSETVLDDLTSELVSLCVAEDVLFNDMIIDSGPNGVMIFVFGGFYPLVDEKGHVVFKASDDMLRIVLSCKDDINGVTFADSAVVSSVKKDLIEKCGMEWPSPRGYFALTLVDKSLYAVNCFIHAEDDQSMKKNDLDHLGGAKKHSYGPSSFFKGRKLLIQGGCDSLGNYFSDFFIFLFDTGTWESLETYCYDYFDRPVDPDMDDERSELRRENMIDPPKFVTAELRSCHHTALYYRSYDQDYLIFIGGFRNDYLRHFDKQPYKSDNYDISRLSKLLFVTNNTNLLRVPVLNLQTQTWRFVRYYYDIDHALSEKFVQRVSHNPIWLNSSIANYAGSISLNGKIVTICHGLAVIVPEKRENMQKIKEEVPVDTMFWGTHVHFNFPSL